MANDRSAYGVCRIPRDYPASNTTPLTYLVAQTFCSTPGVVLSPGMCGGPVVGKRGSICGMIEGIVPVEHPTEAIRGSPVIIEAIDILE